ncbi:MAG: hypothetical protein PHI18_01320, partial [bacterium]|nr:hypothetical protein [bacterium]
MRRYGILFAAAFVVVWGGAYLSATLVTCPSFGSGDQSEAHQMLLREANLVEYFCLSRIPPVIGRSSVPSEWETA